jgi:predicted nucleotidyltransferase
MRPSLALAQHRAGIRQIVAAHRGANPRVFGSAARGTDHEGSDLDVLVDEQPGMTLLDLAQIQAEITALTQVKADVMTSYFTRPRLKQRVLAEAQAI